MGCDSWLENRKQNSMWLAGKADSITWARLWNACELETADRRTGLEKGSDEFYRAVADRFSELIDRTQVVDSVMHRTQMMRSGDALNRMASSFMSEPSKVYNMLIDTVYDLRNARGAQAKKTARKRLARTVFALTASFAVNAAAQALMDAVRDDDREKKYLEKFCAAWVENFAAGFNPLSYVPFAKDIASILQGYDVSRMDMDPVNKTVRAADSTWKALNGENKHTQAGALVNLFAEGSRLFGLATANVKRDVRAVIMTVAIESDNYLLQYRLDRALLDMNYSGNSKTFMDTLYSAMKSDREAYEIIYADMVENGMPPEKISKAMEARMKEDKGVQSVDELERRYLTPPQQSRYDAMWREIGTTAVYRRASDEQLEKAEGRLYEYVTGDKQMAEKMEEVEKAGITPEQYILYKLACEVVSRDGNNNTNQEEAEAAIDLLTGLSREERAYLWQSTNKGWKEGSNPYR